MMTPEQAKARSDRFGVDTGPVCKVQQHLRDEVDINTIVRRFGMTGEVPQGVPTGVYADLTGIEDLESAVELVDTVRSRFSALPAEVRDRFRNDPVHFAVSVRDYSEQELDRLTAPPAPVPSAPVGPGAPAPAGEAAASPGS